jgi:predicted TIM-barrel fold metal-dependent hydrolase
MGPGYRDVFKAQGDSYSEKLRQIQDIGEDRLADREKIAYGNAERLLKL